MKTNALLTANKRVEVHGCVYAFSCVENPKDIRSHSRHKESIERVITTRANEIRSMGFQMQVRNADFMRNRLFTIRDELRNLYIHNRTVSFPENSNDRLDCTIPYEVFRFSKTTDSNYLCHK